MLCHQIGDQRDQAGGQISALRSGPVGEAVGEQFDGVRSDGLHVRCVSQRESDEIVERHLSGEQLCGSVQHRERSGAVERVVGGTPIGRRLADTAHGVVQRPHQTGIGREPHEFGVESGLPYQLVERQGVIVACAQRPQQGVVVAVAELPNLREGEARARQAPDLAEPSLVALVVLRHSPLACGRVQEPDLLVVAHGVDAHRVRRCQLFDSHRLSVGAL